MAAHIVCFGETLWDIFPDKKVIGGAPLNVALRAYTLGAKIRIISSVGKDIDGEQLLDFLRVREVNVKSIQINNRYPTGNVQVHLDKNNTATYTISEPVAWDYIMPNQEDVDQIKLADVFIFGSLSCRNSVTKNTLLEYLSYASFKVFDANLRTPYYKMESIVELMLASDLIKLNDEELEEISQFLGVYSKTLDEQIIYLSKFTKTKHVCITLGAEGAVLYSNSVFYRNPGYKVKVQDTVGAGDSFLASLIYQMIQGIEPQILLDYSCAMGSLVASKNGATAIVDTLEIDQLMNAI